MPVRLTPEVEAEFKTLPNGEKLLRSFYEWIDTMNADFVRPHVALAELGMIEARLGFAEIARNNMLLYQHTSGLRATMLLNECIRALNEGRLYSFALTARALIEAGAGVIHYLGLLNVHASTIEKDLKLAVAKRSKSAFEKATKQFIEFLKTLDMGTTKGRFSWNDFTKGGATRDALREKFAKSPKDAAAVGPVNVMTMLEKLERRQQEIMPESAGTAQMIYALLSDICHPAVGGNLLLWTADARQVNVSGGYDLSKRKLLIQQVLPIVFLCAAIILPAYGEMDKLLERVTTRFLELLPIEARE